MKTETGYIYHEGISAEMKPDTKTDEFWEGVGQSDMYLNDSKYRKALKEWKRTLIPVKNHVSIMLPHYWIKIARKVSLRFDPGDKIEHNKGTVTKIL